MAKVQIDLVLIDAYTSKNPKPITALTDGLANKLHSLTNYYQSEGDLHGREITLGQADQGLNITQIAVEPGHMHTVNGKDVEFGTFAEKYMGPNDKFKLISVHLAVDDWLKEDLVTLIDNKLQGK